MATLAIDKISALLAVVLIGVAVRKWQIIRDRHLILSTIKLALQERKAVWIGTLLGLCYLAVFMILGGRGGRIHILFGRLIWNTTSGEIVAGLVLALLVMISMTMFVYGVRVKGFAQSGKKSGMGLFGAVLALVASFCP
jgi:hypothetical protein